MEGETVAGREEGGGAVEQGIVVSVKEEFAFVR